MAWQKRNVSRFVAGLALSSLIGVAAVAAPAAAATRIGHGATAYGTSIQLSSVFTSGPTALATLGCTNHAGMLHNNSALSAGLLTAGSVGAINDSVSTTSSSTSGTSNIASVSLFSSLVTADAITANATASKSDSGFATTGDTTVANLSINGSPMSAPAPNTVVPLPGLGTLTVNEQISNIKSDSAAMVVNALHLHVDVTNVFNFPVGTDVIVGHVRVVLNQNPPRFVDGTAYATQFFGTGLASGKTALVHLPCEGTDGVVKTNTIAGTVIPGVISTGTLKSTASGVASKSSASAQTTSEVQNITLIGLISVDAVKAQANASLIGKDRTFTDSGSSFTNLSVLGIPTIPDSVPANSVYPMPGVGTLYLHRVLVTKHHIEVRMIELVLSVSTGTLPAGTDIRIGVAEASVH